MNHGRVILAALLCTAPAAVSWATPPPGPFEGTADHVHVTAVSPVDHDQTRYVVTLAVDAGYHINANPASDVDLIPTILHVTNGAPSRVIYPPPTRFKPKFSDQAIDVYEGLVYITAEFARDAAPPRALSGTVTAQACTDVICLPPADVPLPGRATAPSTK